MKQITQLGATVEEAISIALQQLSTTREQVEVEVLQEAKKDFWFWGTESGSTCHCKRGRNCKDKLNR